MKINIGRFEIDLRSFIMMSFLFGVSVYLRAGLQSAVIQGLAFGAGMTFFVSLIKMKRPENKYTDSLLTIELPRPLFYFFGVGLWIFSFLLCIFLLTAKMSAFVLVPICLIGICIYAYFSETRQIHITETEIIVREGIVKLDSEKRYQIRDIQDATIKWWGGLIVTFRSQQKIRLYPYCERLYSLPASKDETPHEMRNALLRLKDELMRRKLNPTVAESAPLPAFNPVGFKPIWSMGAAVLSLLAVLMYPSYVKSIEKISVPNQALRQHDFENAFEWYKGKKYAQLREQYRQLCADKKDFNCRLHSYFLSIEGNEQEALNFAKMSCSAKDPQSCYIVYTNEKASVDDRKPASELLDTVCMTPEYKDQTCCTCYKQKVSEN